MPGASRAQDFAPEVPQAGVEVDVDQALVDLDALVVAKQATTRCALYDSGAEYLDPLADAAIRIRIDEMEASLAPEVEDLADRVSVMHAQANAVPCGHVGLDPFLDFAAQVAADVIDIAMRVWAETDILPCAYFADDGFLAAAERARTAAQDLEAEPDPARRAYLTELAQRWITVFERNCANPAFDPTLTLPGQIALALPAGSS